MSQRTGSKRRAKRASSARPVVRERTRTRLLEAARQIVAEEGVDAITLRGLAERAAVSVQSVYNLFGNKDRLIGALVEDELGRLDAAFEAVIDEDSIQRLRTQYALFVESAISQTRRPLTLAVLNDATLTERVFGSWRSHATMEDGIRRAIVDGHLRGDVSPSALAEHIRGSLIHVLRLWAAGVLSNADLRSQAAFGLDIALLAIAEGPTRDRILARGDKPARRG